MTTAPSRASRSAPSPAGSSGTEHLNEITLRGALSKTPQRRELSDGSTVSSFVLLVRTAERGTDAIDCVARTPGLQSRVEARRPGDQLEVSGALRHRFWRSDSTTMSRYEVEVDAVRAVRRRDVTGRRSGE